VGVAEAAYGIAIGAAVKGYDAKGCWCPNPLISNSAKVIGVDGFNRVLMNLAEIAGGIPVTAPSEFDLKNPEIGKLVEKYLRGSEKFTAEQRMKIIKFIEFWATSSHLVGAIHGGGSPAAAIIFLQMLADFAEKEEAVKEAIDL
ncbi:MAG: 4-hydroxyphenylacetate 3-hydroxylase, partial [Archaeoglobus sp.]|nr:4-hydroxyphenylacetate 3-hydroxylase [Archaeoglobus sp.]